MGLRPAQSQLFFNLRAGTVDDDDPHAHRCEQRNILYERVEPSGNHELAWKGDHKSFTTERMDIRRDPAQPSDKGAGVRR